MSQLLTIPTNAITLPAPRVAINVRVATLDDIPFMDELQKKHQKMLGFMPRKTLEGKIGLGHVLVAESPSPLPSPGVPGEGVRVGYCISQDRYMGRDDVGVIYQMNVAPVQQRKLIGATLVKTIFERAAYGCRLFCCWCAQDIAANYFWESLGFVPLAFRTGGVGKASPSVASSLRRSVASPRIHIFWQRRIREGDTATPYWFPAETRGGMMNEARLVLPIPPGTHWSDAKPILLPGGQGNRQLEDGKKEMRRPKAEPLKATVGPRGMALRGWSFAPPAQTVGKPSSKPQRTRAKNDPKLVAAARELRDRWIEQIDDGRLLPCTDCKYDVSRALPTPTDRDFNSTNASVKLLPDAA